MKKRNLFIPLLSIIALTSATPMIVACGNGDEPKPPIPPQPSKYLEYDIDDYEDKTCCVIGYTKEEEEKEEAFAIPETTEIDGETYTVIGIDDYVFEENAVVKEVLLPKTIEYIGDSTFAWCTNLEKINFPESLEYIGDSAFCYTKIKSADLSNCKDIDEIDNDTFLYATDLVEIKLPPALEEIGRDAFSGCKSLRSITIPNTMYYIEGNIFKCCDNLREINIDNEYYTSGPKKCFLIDKDADDNNEPYKIFAGLANAVFPEDKDYLVLTDTFVGLDSLTKLSIPANLTLNGGFFNRCPNLKNIQFAPGSPYSIGGDGGANCIVYNDSKTQKCQIVSAYEGFVFPRNCIGALQYSFNSFKVDTFEVPNYVEELNDYAFSGAQFNKIIFNNKTANLGTIKGSHGLTEVNLGDDVEQITGDLYNSTSTRNIKKVTIGSKIKIIPDSCFENWHGLTDIIIPEGVEEIQFEAFRECNSLQSIAIPKTVKKLGAIKDHQGEVFLDCQKLSIIDLSNWGNEVPIVGDDGWCGTNNFNGIANEGKIIFSSDCTDATIASWKNILKDVSTDGPFDNWSYERKQ